MVDPIPKAAEPAPPPKEPTPAETARAAAVSTLVNRRAYHLGQLKELIEAEAKKVFHAAHVEAIEAELVKLGWIKPEKE